MSDALVLANCEAWPLRPEQALPAVILPVPTGNAMMLQATGIDVRDAMALTLSSSRDFVRNQAGDVHSAPLDDGHVGRERPRGAVSAAMLGTPQSIWSIQDLHSSSKKLMLDD
jgi:hypothetical protein